MVRILLQKDILPPYDSRLLRWFNETQDSWTTFFIETLLTHDGPDIQLYHFFDAVFSEIDWSWRNQQPLPWSDPIETIVDDYKRFRAVTEADFRISSTAPSNVTTHLVGVQWISTGIIVTLDFRETPNGTQTARPFDDTGGYERTLVPLPRQGYPPF